MTCLLGFLLTASVAIQASAQQPVRHELIRGDMPPGEAARFYQQADPTLIGHMQPVQLVAPADTTIEVGDAASSFGQSQASQMTVAMGIGYVYRFKLSNFPQPDAAGQTLYPSIEVIGKLSPPQGLENDFPIQVVVTRQDIDIALAGRMVTRVIYLEDSRGTLPHLHTEGAQPSVDVRSGQDPLRAAQQMGRPMAILRMGSRVPMPGEIAEWFTFGVAAPRVLPNPRPANLAGLSERELKIVRAMEAAEANFQVEVVESKTEPVAPVEQRNQGNPVEQSEQVSLADFDAGDTDEPRLSQTANEEVIDISKSRIDTFAQTFVASIPQQPTKPKAFKPNWVKVKANAKPRMQTSRPKIKNMIQIRATPATDEESSARPPAPSMADQGVESLNDIAPQVQPLVAPMLRRPNEL